MSSCWKSACPIFALNRRVHSAARTFSGPPITLLTSLWFSSTSFPGSFLFPSPGAREERLERPGEGRRDPGNEVVTFFFAAANCVWNEKVGYRCLTMNLYSFVLITRHKFLSTYQIIVSNEFWRFFDAVRSFYINSAPELNRLFDGNGWWFIRWHSYIIVAEETVAFIFKSIRAICD